MKNVNTYLPDILTLAGGSVIYAIGFNMFLLPAGIFMGGISGIAEIINLIWKLPVGTAVFILNIPLMILGIRTFGFKFMAKTVSGTAAASAAIDLIKFLPVTVTDPLLCSVFGGSLIGFGLGIMFAKEFTTGGSDLAAWLLKSRFRQIPIEKLVLYIDIAVIGAAALVTGSTYTLFYSGVQVYVSAKVMGFILYGSNKARLMYIFSVNYAAIAEKISMELERGISLINGTGWYTGEERKIIMCAITPKEVQKIKSIVKSSDREAFMICCEVTEICGEGFGGIEI